MKITRFIVFSMIIMMTAFFAEPFSAAENAEEWFLQGENAEDVLPEEEIPTEIVLDRIADLQQALNDAKIEGIPELVVDGQFGDETSSALEQYCKQNEIDYNTDITQDLINRVLEQLRKDTDGAAEEDPQLQEEPDITQEEPDVTQEEADSTQEEPDSTQEEPDSTQEEADVTQEEPGSTQEEADVTQEEPEILTEGTTILIDPPAGNKIGIIYAKEVNGKWEAVHDFYCGSLLVLIGICVLLVIIAIGIFIVGIMLINKIRK